MLSKLMFWRQKAPQLNVEASDVVSGADYVDPRDCGLVDLVQSGWFQNESGELFQGFPIGGDDVVLDVGCGAGFATMYAASRGAHVIFSDVVAEKVENLRERVVATPARTEQGLVSDSDPLPLADATATRVAALEMLEHVSDPQKVMRELVRVGKPGALYLLAVPDARSEHMQQGLLIGHRGTYGFFWSMWMLIYWTWAKSTGQDLDSIPHDVVQPPYPQIVNDWAKLWHAIIKMPASDSMKNAG